MKIQRGDRGPVVEAWQKFLHTQSFDPGKVDGDFGPRTDAATRAFQGAASLVADGIVGKNTMRVATDLGFRLPDPATPPTEDFTARVPIPSGINLALSPAGQATMLEILGAPGQKSEDCSAVTSAKVAGLLVTRDVGPFLARGLRPAVEALERVFAAVSTAHPDLFALLGTAGMLCCRKVRGGTNFSNHSWGTAVDVKIGGVLDTVGDDRCQRGLVVLAPFFHAERFFWGVGFSREDAMHFEASDELVRSWKAQGIV